MAEVAVADVPTLPSADPPRRERRERLPGPGRRKAVVWAAVLAIIVGGVSFLSTRSFQRPAQVGAQAAKAPYEPARLSSSGSRLFDRGLDGTLQRYLSQGYYIAVERRDDGTLSNHLIYEDMMSKDFSIVQELARIKSEALEKPLFIIGGTPPQVVDRVNPDDRQARREYMMLVWTLKQESLGWNRERYLSREALDPQRTVDAMARFIEAHPNSRMVGAALKDLRHACYIGLQDPFKFRQVVEALVDRALLATHPGTDGAPELARVVLPYLKDAVNQVLYQRIYKIEAASRARHGKGRALGSTDAPSSDN